MKFVAVISQLVLLFACLAAAFYLGAAGWTRMDIDYLESVPVDPDTTSLGYEADGISFRDKNAVERYYLEKRAEQYFPWALQLPSAMVLLAFAGAFGAVGGMCRLSKAAVVDRESVSVSDIAFLPLFGAVVGWLLLSVALAVPGVFILGESTLRPTTLMAICILGGAFSTRTFAWIEGRLDAVFDKARRSQGSVHQNAREDNDHSGDRYR